MTNVQDLIVITGVDVTDRSKPRITSSGGVGGKGAGVLQAALGCADLVGQSLLLERDSCSTDCPFLASHENKKRIESRVCVLFQA